MPDSGHGERGKNKDQPANNNNSSGGNDVAKKSLKQRAMAGEAVPGAMVFEFFSPGIAQVLAHAGAEFVIYDMEHTGISLETVKDQVAHCRGIGIAPMVRVPRGEYHFLARALDI